MPLLRLRVIAESRGMTLADVQRQARLSVSTARRYWYSSASGLERDGGTLREVNLSVLRAIADVLEVTPGELIDQRETHTLQGGTDAPLL